MRQKLPLVSSMVVERNETPSQTLFWDGFIANCEGFTLDELPTERQKTGWQAAESIKNDAEYTIEDDHEFYRTGGR